MTEEERQLSLLKGSRQKGEKAPGPSEFQMHCAVADWLRVGAAPDWLWTHFPAGEYRTDETGRRLKRMGVMRGWPDFLLLDPLGRLHCLELKRPGMKLSPEQSQFRLEMDCRDLPFAVAFTVDEAFDVLRRWGAIKVSLADQLSAGRER